MVGLCLGTVIPGINMLGEILALGDEFICDIQSAFAETHN